MIPKEPKINDEIKAILLSLQVKNDRGEHFLQMIQGLIHRIIIEMDNDAPDPYNYMSAQEYLKSLVGLHSIIGTLAYPDGDRFDPPAC